MLLRWLDSLEGWRGDRKTGKRMGKGGIRREIRREKGGKKEGDKRKKRTREQREQSTIYTVHIIKKGKSNITTFFYRKDPCLSWHLCGPGSLLISWMPSRGTQFY